MRKTSDEVAVAVEEDGSCSVETLSHLRAAPLLHVCKDLEPFLTNESTVAPAMRTLARAAVQRPSLQPAEFSFLGTFFAEKAATPTYCDAATSCLKMVIEDAVQCGNGQSLTQAFELVLDKFLPAAQWQERPVAARRTCFSLLRDVLVEETVSSTSLCTAKRLRAVLEALDGEGDPQLVVKMFAIEHDVLSWAPVHVLKEVAEDFFETLASYFPVLFTQPPGCPVSKKDLQSGLSRCLSHPTLAELSIPFLLGKMASPSAVVKLDVIQTLDECADLYPAALFLGHFAGDVVTRLRNEVVKMSAFANQGDSSTSSTAATPTKVISAGCALLTKIAHLCDQGGSGGGPVEEAKVLQIFESVNEGAIQAVSGGAARHTCSAYATMLFSTIIGSWSVCLISGGYVFTMMTLVAGEEDEISVSETTNGCVLLSALCAGFVDALDAACGEEAEGGGEKGGTLHKTQLLAKLAKALRAFSAIVNAACAALISSLCRSTGEGQEEEIFDSLRGGVGVLGTQT